jgi:Holliday junction DNA helicase RuvA
MFNSLRGRITEKQYDSLCLATGGVEWEISVPATDLNRLPPSGEEARVFTWLLHRENEMRLYGFAEEGGRSLFLELLKVEGIGPKGALKIMGNIALEELERALEAGDLDRLEAVPGLGKKTAQRLVLALKGRIVHKAAASPTPWDELAAALEGMGYERKAAVEALEKASEGLAQSLSGEEKEKQLFRQAIIILSTR